MKNDEIYIFWMDTSEIINEQQLGDSPFALCNERKAINSQNFRQKKQSLFSKYLLVHGLKITDEEVPQSINFRTNGKPYFKDSSVHFNISHSGNLVICAISKATVGIDLQEIVSFRKGSEGVFLTQAERAIIHPEDYLKVWSMKEATYKGFGFEFGAKLTDFKYLQPDLMEHQQGQIKIIEQSIAEGYHCYLAIQPSNKSCVNISKVFVNQLIS
jgi:4'-phosphopantetheinyl transferase